MVQLIGYLEMSERLKILWFHLNFGKPRLKMLEEREVVEKMKKRKSD